jgi:hypothetical protein
VTTISEARAMFARQKDDEPPLILLWYFRPDDADQTRWEAFVDMYEDPLSDSVAKRVQERFKRFCEEQDADLNP